MKSRIGSSRCGLLLLLVAVGAGAACNGAGAQVPADGAPGGDTGTDAAAGMGAAGTGGAGTGGAGTGGAGTGGAGTGGAGTGGAGTGGQKLPGCLRDLLATCSITGSCSYEPTDAGAPQRLCYASGASSVTEGYVCTTSGGGQTTVVSKADGALCYTLNHSGNVWQACEIDSYRWTDASGALVATATVGYPGITVGCGGGAETSISPNWTDAPALFGHEACTSGACP